MYLKKRALWPMVVVLLTAPMAASGGSTCSKVKAIITPGNQIVAEASSVNGQRVPTVVTFDGNNSNPKNNTACQWAQTSGPQVTIANPNSCTVTFTAPDVGSSGQDLIFLLTVTSTESGCTTLTDTLDTTISVTDIITNRPPVASVTAPVSVNEGMTVFLDGSASSDPDGDMVTFTWSQVSGTPVTIATPAPGLAAFTAPAEQYPNGETLGFQLTVSDGSISNSTGIILITVQSVNQAPVASISCPTEVSEGASVTLSDNNSYDPDQGTLTYQWNQNQGVPNADLDNVDMTASIIRLTAPALITPTFDTMKFGLTVTDNGNLSSSAQCDVKVLDVTAPVISGVNDMTEEATSASGAAVAYAPVAHDAFYGDVAVTCDPISGSTFAFGTTTVKCTATDMATNPNTAQASFRVTVVDTTPPTLTLPEPIGPIEGNALGGANIDYTASASDLVDGTVKVTCNNTPGSLFVVGTTTVTCSAFDAHGNNATGSFNVTVQDKTPPVVTVPSNITAEATGPSGATVTFSASALDVVDGSIAPTCSPVSGAIFKLGETPVNCSAIDNAGNIKRESFTVTVKDTIAPVVTPPADMTVYATGLLTPVNFGSATATDAVGVDSLGSNAPAGFPVGTTTITWTAKDEAGNAGTATSTVTVRPWTLSGFYNPIDMNGVTNTVRGGSTIPVKFEVFSGATELTSTSSISSIKTVVVNCSSMSAAEGSVPIDALATGGTVLRYDTTAGHYIYNWQTTKSPGTCYIVTATTLEGTKISANFKLK